VTTSVAAPAGALEALRDLGLNMISMSNNHAFARGVQGIVDTRREAIARGFACAGTGESRRGRAACVPGHAERDRRHPRDGIRNAATGLRGHGVSSGTQRSPCRRRHTRCREWTSERSRYGPNPRVHSPKEHNTLNI
jgi:hypothetical protein